MRQRTSHIVQNARERLDEVIDQEQFSQLSQAGGASVWKLLLIAFATASLQMNNGYASGIQARNLSMIDNHLATPQILEDSTFAQESLQLEHDHLNSIGISRSLPGDFLGDALEFQDAKEPFEDALSYKDDPNLPEDSKKMFDASWSADVVSTWKGADEWENTLIGKMQSLTPGPDVDDHKGTPIGEGDSIGLVAAEVQMDNSFLDMLPADFQSGVFTQCDGPCAKWPGAVRVSHTNAADIDLMRIALKFDAGPLGVVDLTFTETLTTFPIANKEQLEAFTYSVDHSMLSTLWKYPTAMAKMGYNAFHAKSKWGNLAKLHGPTGKEYYSLTPFQIGGEGGKAASAMKWRLVPKQGTPYPEMPEKASQDVVKQKMREQFATVVSSGDVEFDLEIQIATDPVKHPINDASVEWDAPWTPMGSVRIPKQHFPSDAATLTPQDAVGSGLTEDGHLDFSSKEFLFAPGSSPHKPLGDINAFRAHLYPIYDKARQEHLLGKHGGQPAKCPFKHILDWAR